MWQISKKLIEIMHEFYPRVEKTSFNINIEENISSVQFEGTEIIQINWGYRFPTLEDVNYPLFTSLGDLIGQIS